MILAVLCGLVLSNELVAHLDAGQCLSLLHPKKGASFFLPSGELPMKDVRSCLADIGIHPSLPPVGAPQVPALGNSDP